MKNRAGVRSGVETALDAAERERLENRVAEAEKQSGAEIVLAVAARSDCYAELPWKAFALGAVVGGGAAAAFALVNPVWLPGAAALLAVVATLGGGLVALLACLVLPCFARLLLDAHRAEVEARQYAQALFLERELFATRERCGVLLLVSLFERRLVLLPDRGLAARLDASAMEKIVARVAGHLRNNRVSRALEEGLAALVEALGAPPPNGSPVNELPDRIVEGEKP
jgi:putative membrane protein